MKIFGHSFRNHSPAINENFDLRPGNIVRELALDKPVYLPTAAFGHFGRSEFSWEKNKRAQNLKS